MENNHQSHVWLRQMLIYRYTKLIEKMNTIYGIPEERRKILIKRFTNNEWLDEAIESLPSNKITEIYQGGKL